MAETIGTAVVKVVADARDFAPDAKRQIRAHSAELEKAGEEGSNSVHDGADKQDEKRWKQRLAKWKARLAKVGQDFARLGEKMGKGLGRAEEALGRFGERMGKAFGKGSRNDFLNLVGGFMSLLPRAIGASLGALGRLLGKLGEVGKGAQDTEETVGGLKDVFLNLAKQGLPGLAAAAAIAVVAMESVALAAGPMGAAISLATGLVLALAGSLGFALVGAVAAVGGAMVPLAAGLGVGALALAGVQKATGKLKEESKDFKKSWEDLQMTAAKSVFGKDGGGFRSLQSVLKAIKPVVEAVGGALGGLITQFGKATQGKQFRDLMGDLAKILPPMVTSLGQIAGNIGTFLLEAFRDASPFIQDFLGWLERVTQKWADFGKQGKGGKKSGLAKFFDDAVDSALIIWDLIKQVGTALGLLFKAGKGTGDSIFQEVADQVGQIVTWLKDPANQDTLKQWFADAKTFGDKLGDIVVDVVKLVDALDTPANRGVLFTLLDVIDGVIQGITSLMTFIEQVNIAVVGFVMGLGPFFSDLGSKISGAAQSISELPGKIIGFFTGLASKIWTAAGNLAQTFTTWVSGVVTSIPGVINSILQSWAGLDNKIATSAGNMASTFATWLAGLPAQAITVAGQIIVGFINLAGRMITAAGNILGAFTQWLVDLPGIAAQAAVNITVAFINLSIKIFQKAGSLAAAFGAWLSTVPGKMRSFAQSLPGYFSGLANKIITRAGNIASAFASWLSALPGRARSAVVSIINAFAGLASKAIARAGSIASAITSWLASLPGKARGIANQIAAAFSGLASKAISRAGSIVAALGHWASGVGGRAARVADDIVNAFRGLAGRIVAAIGTIIPKISMPHITIPHITPIVDKPGAAGFVTAGPQFRLIGEAGPEAVVPLNRPLSKVDPAVRMLSAIAQGKVPGLAGGGVSPGRTIDVGGITINTPTEDPRAVASEVVARMAAAAYI